MTKLYTSLADYPPTASMLSDEQKEQVRAQEREKAVAEIMTAVGQATIEAVLRKEYKMRPEKLIRDGKVAVLISPEFGAGWSTWSSDYNEFLAFDAGLVRLAEDEADEGKVKAYLMLKLGEDADVHLGGWDGVEVVWLEEGTEFYIHEYDGSESIKTASDLIMKA